MTSKLSDFHETNICLYSVVIGHVTAAVAAHYSDFTLITVRPITFFQKLEPALVGDHHLKFDDTLRGMFAKAETLLN